MIALTRSLLERSPEETSRTLLLGLLEQAGSALERLEKAADEEALHDFRVALRRLRSLARCYRAYLRGSVKKKHRSRLKELASATTAARDAEVQMAWLSGEAPKLEPDARSGAAHLLERLRERPSAMPPVEKLRADFDALRKSLEKSLVRVRLRLDAESRSFLSATGRILQERASKLKETLGGVHSPEQGDLLHRARIQAKRLRYVLEPLQKELSEIRALVKKMKSLQDSLGELQDTRVLMQSISEQLEASALAEARRLRDLALLHAPGTPPPALSLRDSPPARPALGLKAPLHAPGTPPPALSLRDSPPARPALGLKALQGSTPVQELSLPVPGLLALLGFQRERRDRQYRELERTWLSGASEPFFRELLALASRLAGSAPPAGASRRFLLSAVPEAARKKAPQLLRQGFVPGRRIREQVVSIRSGRRTKNLRITSLENGASVEEPLAPEDFERFWRFCTERRLERRRYEVREDGRAVWIDEVRERGLIVAEVPDEGDGALPDWLRAVVVREVTGSPKYEWEAVARRPRTASS